ncbi:uncharacterized protein LY89DRAFT_122139 [Mollisia scopiformis]|uniref:Uncharacterized protein n=1 Tax=Mollisia scopiformis TaxID=149040 RepID=A0A194X3N4_MOLSC|nr:uncharacterized protein LY89DRAFT_122139 [Mollisia scopiformis]KUJ14776.1 hypothetical protein LY89DRAFT_122139 [Mollisia scopiformis]
MLASFLRHQTLSFDKRLRLLSSTSSSTSSFPAGSTATSSPLRHRLVRTKPSDQPLKQLNPSALGRLGLCFCFPEKSPT